MSRMIVDHTEEVGLDLPLGDGRFARLAYPADLTVEEAQRLAGIVATLGVEPTRLGAGDD